MPSAIVVGGGIAGLVMARDLVLGGMDVTLLEASDHLGGKVARHTVAGITLDAGAESFATRRGTVADLARTLGLDSGIVRPNPAGAWLQTASGEAYPLPRTGILGIPGTPMAADVIQVIGFRAALRAQLDELLFGFLGSKEKSLGRLVRRRMGRGVLEQLVAPVTLGIHSRHPDDLEVDVVAPGLRRAMVKTGSLAHGVRELREAAPAGTAVSGLVGGVYGLVEALTRDLERFGVTVRLSSPVVAADATGVSLANGELFGADHIVLSTPLGVPAHLPPAIVLVTLVVDSAGLDSAPRGTGVLVARPDASGSSPAGADKAAIHAKALTHGTAKWEWLAERVPAHRHVLRLSFDGEAVSGIGDERLAQLAREDAAALLGTPLPEASVVAFDRVDWASPAAAAEGLPGVVIIGEGAAGTGLAAVIAHAHREAGRLLEGVEA